MDRVEEGSVCQAGRSVDLRMTPAEVATALADRVPGRTNALPLVKSGARVAVRAGGVEATGTVQYSYGTAGNAVARVVLDTTGTVVEVSWDRLWEEAA